MLKELYSLILSNSTIIETLFHLNNNYQINNINQTKRTIIKFCSLYQIYNYIPIIKDLLNDIYNNDNVVSYLITETFENKSIIYEIKINNHPLFDNYNYIYKFRFFIYLSIDNNNKNKINIQLKTNNINIDDPNPINHTIFHIISNYIENDHINYIKKDILEKELKPLLSSISPHFFELNII
jgi:hypothetical protein